MGEKEMGALPWYCYGMQRGETYKRVHVTYESAMTMATQLGNVTLIMPDGKIFRVYTHYKGKGTTSRIYRNGVLLAVWEQGRGIYRPSKEHWRNAICEINEGITKILEEFGFLSVIQEARKEGYTDIEIEGITFFVGLCALQLLPLVVEREKYPPDRVFREDGLVSLIHSQPAVLLYFSPEEVTWLVDVSVAYVFLMSKVRGAYPEPYVQYVFGVIREIVSGCGQAKRESDCGPGRQK